MHLLHNVWPRLKRQRAGRTAGRPARQPMNGVTWSYRRSKIPNKMYIRQYVCMYRRNLTINSLYTLRPSSLVPYTILQLLHRFSTWRQQFRQLTWSGHYFCSSVCLSLCVCVCVCHVRGFLEDDILTTLLNPTQGRSSNLTQPVPVSMVRAVHVFT